MYVTFTLKSFMMVIFLFCLSSAFCVVCVFFFVMVVFGLFCSVLSLPGNDVLLFRFLLSAFHIFFS